MSPDCLPEDYFVHFDAINAIVKKSGTGLEGNVYYDAIQPDPRRDNTCDNFRRKRANFVNFCQQGHCLLEIGTGAGHSALIALAQGLDYKGIDWCYYPYVRPAAAYLTEKFGDRFKLFEGNSIDTVRKSYYGANLLHIDGHTGVEFVTLDVNNAIFMARRGAWILIDDTDLPHVRKVYDDHVARGTILPEKPDGWLDTPHHCVGRLPK